MVVILRCKLGANVIWVNLPGKFCEEQMEHPKQVLVSILQELYILRCILKFARASRPHVSTARTKDS